MLKSLLILFFALPTLFCHVHYDDKYVRYRSKVCIKVEKNIPACPFSVVYVRNQNLIKNLYNHLEYLVSPQPHLVVSFEQLYNYGMRIYGKNILIRDRQDTWTSLQMYRLSKNVIFNFPKPNNRPFILKKVPKPTIILAKQCYPHIGLPACKDKELPYELNKNTTTLVVTTEATGTTLSSENNYTYLTTSEQSNVEETDNTETTRTTFQGEDVSPIEIKIKELKKLHSNSNKLRNGVHEENVNDEYVAIVDKSDLNPFTVNLNIPLTVIFEDHNSTYVPDLDENISETTTTSSEGNEVGTTISNFNEKSTTISGRFRNFNEQPKEITSNVKSSDVISPPHSMSGNTSVEDKPESKTEDYSIESTATEGYSTESTTTEEPSAESTTTDNSEFTTEDKKFKYANIQEISTRVTDSLLTTVPTIVNKSTEINNKSDNHFYQERIEEITEVTTPNFRAKSNASNEEIEYIHYSSNSSQQTEYVSEDKHNRLINETSTNETETKYSETTTQTEFENMVDTSSSETTLKPNVSEIIENMLDSTESVRDSSTNTPYSDSSEFVEFATAVPPANVYGRFGNQRIKRSGLAKIKTWQLGSVLLK